MNFIHANTTIFRVKTKHSIHTFPRVYFVPQACQNSADIRCFPLKYLSYFCHSYKNNLGDLDEAERIPQEGRPVQFS